MKRGFQLFNNKPSVQVSSVTGIEKLTFLDKNKREMVREALKEEFSREGAPIDIHYAGLGSKDPFGAEELIVLTVDYDRNSRDSDKAGKRDKCSLIPAIGRGIFRPYGVEYFKVRNKRPQAI